MFDVEPLESASDASKPVQCAPPPADTIAVLNTAEVRVSAEEGTDGAAEGSKGGDGGQKVTPWEVEVSEAERREVAGERFPRVFFFTL